MGTHVYACLYRIPKSHEAEPCDRPEREQQNQQYDTTGCYAPEQGTRLCMELAAPLLRLQVRQCFMHGGNSGVLPRPRAELNIYMFFPAFDMEVLVHGRLVYQLMSRGVRGVPLGTSASIAEVLTQPRVPVKVST